MGNQPGKLHHYNNQTGRPKKMVHWKSAERPSPPGRPILIPLSDLQPDVINLRWDPPKYDGGSPIIGYVVEHRRMSSPHWVRATPSLILQCEVSISGLEPGWRYQFRSFAENVVGRSDPSELSDALTVTLQRNAISVPRFVDELQDLHAVEDERIEFRVRVLGQPPPEVFWFKDGYEIFSSRRTKIINENGMSALIIHQVALTDEGEIKCTATNRAGHVITTAKLFVQAPPKIRLPRTYEDGFIAEADEMLRLKVGIAGQPSPTVTWFHEGEAITDTNRYEITTTERNSMLKIHNVQRNDRGEYIIRAANKLGVDTASFLVTVTSRPNPPGKVRLYMSFGKSTTLSWTPPIDDGGCKIGNYIVEYFRVGWNVWLKATTTRSLTTTLYDLIEGSEYKFRVKAENPYGVSDPSEESDVLFIPDLKRGITKLQSEASPISGKKKSGSSRRKTGPPPKDQCDASTETNIIKAKPKVLDTEDLHREMSYGTPDQMLKMDVRKSPSPRKPDNYLQNQDNVPAMISSKLSPNLVNESSQVHSLKEKSPIQFELKPNTISKTMPATSEMIKNSILSKKSLSPIPSGQTTPESTKRSAKLPKTTPALERSTESVHYDVQQLIKQNAVQESKPTLNVPSLAVAIAMKSATSMIDEKDQDKQREKEKEKERQIRMQIQKQKEVARIRQEEKEKEIAKEREKEKQKEREGEWEKKRETERKREQEKERQREWERERDWEREMEFERKIEREREMEMEAETQNIKPSIVIPDSNPDESPVESTPAQNGQMQPLTRTDKQEDVHTSNELLLVVFNKKIKVKDKDKQNSFELEPEEALQLTPLSISAPDLASLDFTNLHTFPLRRSVSSTELLYERAMARFYEAVRFEESEKRRKLQTSQDRVISSNNPIQTTKRKPLRSMTTAERLSFENRTELKQSWRAREQLSDDNEMKFLTRARNESQDAESELSDHQIESNQLKSFDMDSDYTDSTESSEHESIDSIQKFKMELMAHTVKSPARELETYHPQNMSSGVFTPYRAPTPEQAAIVLNRPMPLPSHDFVPKPILKRQSYENMQQDEVQINRDQSKEQIKNAENNNSISQKKLNEDVITPKITESYAELEIKRKAKELEEQKEREVKRQVQEESLAAVDHYSDLVRQVSCTRKYHTPIYMDPNELEKAAAKAAKEVMLSTENGADSNAMDSEVQSAYNLDKLLSPLANQKPRLSISERGQMIHVRQTASNLAEIQRKQPTLPDTPSEESIPIIPTSFSKMYGPTSSGTSNEDQSSPVLSSLSQDPIEAPQSTAKRTNIVKVKRVIRKRVPSRGRSRDSSQNRPPSRTTHTPSPSPSPTHRNQIDDLNNYALVLANRELERVKSSEASLEDTQVKVRSAISYFTDVVLFLVACYVYLFKDAKLVLPILALIIYRQLGEVASACIPKWLRRKKN